MACDTGSSTSLEQHLKESSLKLTTEEFAAYLDSHDELSHLRKEFIVPKNKNRSDYGGDKPEGESTYLLGNSLGLQPVKTRATVNEQLDKWANIGIEGHFKDPYPWYPIGETAADRILHVVGAKSRREVAVMNSLTVNVHLMLVAFYQPTETRHKIVIESTAFPSDRYAVASQIKQRGFDPKTSLIELKPSQDGELVTRTEDIEDLLEREGDSIAVVMLGGIQFFTGQLFDMKRISELCHAHGCYAGFDLAHAAGNVPLYLHDWDVDFACWCSYKYLNSGPGGIAGAFMHDRHSENFDLNRFAGWWGNDPDKRFEMTHDFQPLPGVASFQLSNPPVLETASLLASLDVFSLTSMEALRKKSLLLTGYLESLLCELLGCERGPSVTQQTAQEPHAKRASCSVKILTPREPDHRGCQLSLKFSCHINAIEDALARQGVVVDGRKPDVIRVAPVPMYNTFSDVHRFVTTLISAMESTRAESSQ
ncbi:kynureninase-like [Sycon ciliatum]|uniref:kynureninase-like n=1 Tax=Sycon ciliatum TaxID=27933 RepID=UPI0031F7217A|eukprot:scpid57581/ scgid15135/ Kynureninase; L-kynurenine hydrolase